jgi:hypothetical protein
MSNSLPFRLVVAGALAVAVGAAAVAFWIRNEHTSDPAPGGEPAAGFREAAQAAGLTWRTSFLPDEQGEKFKINLYDHGSGVAVGDFDGDGRDDIYLVNQLGKNALYRNKGDGAFEDVAEAAGVALGDRVCVSATFVDYDNSGRQSLFVTSTRGGNVLFKNIGGGKFENWTKKAHLEHVGHSQACAFFDFDNDGYLDLLVTNTAKWTTNRFDRRQNYYPGRENILEGAASTPTETNILYRNNGDGTFTDVTKKAGLAGDGWSGDVAVIDYDNDGYPDLLVTNMFGGSTLYRNKGNGTFEDVTKQVLGRTSWGAMGCRAFDYNNYVLLDLFVVDMHSDMWMGVKDDWPAQLEEQIKRGENKKYLYISGPDPNVNWDDTFKVHYDRVVFGNTLYKNVGHGKFEEVSDKAGMETLWPWGIATGDFDNDGYEDVFIPSGMGYPYFYWPNQLMMNNGNGTFSNRAADLGIEPPRRGQYFPEKLGGKLSPRSSRSAAVADFNGDGSLSIIVNNFNDQPYFFKNTFPKKNYIAFRLQGGKTKHKSGGSNRDAIGAVVRLYAGKDVMTRQVNGSTGYLSQSSKTVHFGLGDRAKVDRVEITWPNRAHSVQVIRAAEINRLHEVVEP